MRDFWLVSYQKNPPLSHALARRGPWDQSRINKKAFCGWRKHYKNFVIIKQNVNNTSTVVAAIAEEIEYKYFGTCFRPPTQVKFSTSHSTLSDNPEVLSAISQAA